MGCKQGRTSARASYSAREALYNNGSQGYGNFTEEFTTPATRYRTSDYSFGLPATIGDTLGDTDVCYCFRSDIAEIIVFAMGQPVDPAMAAEVLPDINRKRVEGYLAYKYGLQSQLPQSHVYKTMPPITERP